MKTMTCKQLGGACDEEFYANTFDEMAELSKQHGMEMYYSNDEAHLDAMEKMMQMMQDPISMKQWYTARKKEFDSLPDNL